MPHRILIVDDEQIVLESFQANLEIDGYVVMTAMNGTAALKLCEENSFDLVILDFIMPNMDGIQLLVRIRHIQPHIRSIIISGQLKAELDEKQVKKEIEESVEADLYLHKPISADRLSEAVATTLKAEGEKDWQTLAQEAVKGHKAKLASAKQASKNLRKHKKK